MKIIITILIILLTQQAFLSAEWERCNTPQTGEFYQITKMGNYYFGTTRLGIAISSDSTKTWTILNNQFKDKNIESSFIFSSKNSLYIIFDSKVYKTDDFGVTVQPITESNFPYSYRNVFSHHEDTLFFILNDVLKYYVDDFTSLNEYFNPRDSIRCNKIFEYKGDLIIPTNKGYFKTQSYTNKYTKFDRLDNFPLINYFSHNDDEIYFGYYEIIYKSDDNLATYTKIFEQKDYSISDIQANADGLFVAFHDRGIGFYNLNTKEFEFEEKYKNIGYNKITLIDDDLFFFYSQNLLKAKKIGGEYLISGYEDSHIEKVRLNNDKIFGILSGRLMYSDDEGLNWNIFDNNFLQLTSLEVIDSTFFISYYNLQYKSGGAILRSSNYGNDWIKIKSDINLPYNANDFLYYKNDLFIAGSHGIFCSKDLGKSWFEVDKTIYSPHEFLAIDSFLFAISYWSMKKIYLNENYLSNDFKFYHPDVVNFMIQVNDDVIHYTDLYSWRFYYLSNDRGNSFSRIDKPIYNPRHYLYNETVKKQIIDTTLHFSFDDGVTWINLFDEKDFEFYDFFIMNNYVIANTTQGLYRKKLSDFGTTSVKMRAQDESLIISPNPATDFITIQYSNQGLQPFAERDKVQIFDVLGVEVGQSSLIDNSAHNNSQSVMIDLLRIDVSNLSAGVYYIKFGNRVEKFVKM